MTQNNEPIDKFRDYPVEIALFEHQGKNGPWINADVSKTYKQDDTYKKSRNFNRQDMLKLNALVPQALARMQELDQAPAPSRSEQTDMDDIKDRAEAHIEAQLERRSQDQGQDI